MAELANVACKVSGIVAYCAAGTATLETLRPYLDHVVEQFGTERLVWGSDWPVVNLGGGIEAWIAITRDYLADWPETDAAKLAHGNADRIYGVKLSANN